MLAAANNDSVKNKKLNIMNYQKEVNL